MYSKFLRHKGFTIIEVLISLAIFAIIAIPLSMMVLQSVKINKQSEVKQQSMMVVQNLIESIKSLPDEEILKSSSIQISTDGTLDINKNKDGIFEVSGTVKGYNVGGHIKPLNKYEYQNNKSDISKDINIYIKEDSQIVLDIKDKGGNYSKIVNPTQKNIDITKKDKDTVTINSEEVKSSSNIENIGIFFDKSCKDKYKLSIKNDSDVESGFYIFKEESSKATYDIENSGGIFNIYSNILIPDEKYTNDNRVYEIHIKAKKANDIFESYAYKNIK